MSKLHNAPGRSHRKGMTLMEVMDRFPDEDTAREWFESVIWPGERCCTRCGSTNTHVASHRTMPYRCRDCRKYFSAKTGSALERSKVTYRQWAIAIYLSVTNLKGVASLKLHRDLGVTQKTAWFMMHRLREAWAWGPEEFDGPVEVDETHIGGKRKNMHAKKRRMLEGRGTVGKVAVAGIKDRATKRVQARVVDDKTMATLQPFVEARCTKGAKVYTDEAKAYDGLENREAVKHGVGEYVRGMAHTNGVESFWSMLKRGYMGTYHYMSWKHLQRYVDEFTGRHNIRDMDTIRQMHEVVAGLVGRRLMYKELTAK